MDFGQQNAKKFAARVNITKEKIDSLLELKGAAEADISLHRQLRAAKREYRESYELYDNAKADVRRLELAKQKHRRFDGNGDQN